MGCGTRGRVDLRMYGLEGVWTRGRGDSWTSGRREAGTWGHVVSGT